MGLAGVPGASRRVCGAGGTRGLRWRAASAASKYWASALGGAEKWNGEPHRGHTVAKQRKQQMQRGEAAAADVWQLAQEVAEDWRSVERLALSWGLELSLDS